jgi:hypothetical protein
MRSLGIRATGIRDTFSVMAGSFRGVLGVCCTQVEDFVRVGVSMCAGRNFGLPQWLLNDRQRPIAIGLVVVLHIVVIWVFATSLRYVRPSVELSETEVTLVSPTLSGSEAKTSLIAPPLVTPQVVSITAPDIEIEKEANSSTSTVTAIDMSHVLPPRPDPSHMNPPPQLPSRLAKYAGSLSVILRILVLPDGSIADAQVTRTCGIREIDALAVAYVKDDWKFIAANASGRSVPDWTTVLVPFKAG